MAADKEPFVLIFLPPLHGVDDATPELAKQLTSTLPAVPPLPPPPPTATEPAADCERLPDIAVPPLPPEPPIDCARMAVAWSPDVVTASVL